MNSRINTALASFNNGLNCAQSVLSVYAQELELDTELALRISCGFGAGMGQLQETCGAVTGSFMVLGLLNSIIYSENDDRKEGTKINIQDFSEGFQAIHGTLRCRDLLNCDLKSTQGQKYFKENNLKKHVCEKCISDSIQLIDQIISSRVNK